MDIKYQKDNFQFLYRVSALIYNEDESKVLLFNVEGRDFYLLMGGKIEQLEESIEAIKREVKEELGFENIDYSFLGVSEEFVHAKGFYNQQLNLIYKGIYHGDIIETKFKGLEGDWINFEWIDVDKIDNYKIYSNRIKEIIKKPNRQFHIIENFIKKDHK